MGLGAKDMKGWVALISVGMSLLLARGSRGQGIFDFDEPTTRPSTGVPGSTGVDLRPGPRALPPDRFYLFPPVPWEDATRGVVQLTTPPPVTTAKAPQQVPVVLGELPPIRPASVQALRRRYVEVVSDQQVRDFESVYGDDLKRAAGKRPELMALVETLRKAAADVKDQPTLQRYLLLRAFATARQAGAAEGALLQLAVEIRPLLGQELPAELSQRAEMEGSLADLLIENKRKGLGEGALHVRAAWAGKAFYELAYWQEQHYYLAEGFETLARAEYYAKAGGVDDCLKACAKLHTFLQDWTRLRLEFLEKYHAYRAHPEDPKVNAAYAHAMIVVSMDVPLAAQQPLMKSGDSTLQAVGQALATRDPAARAGALGLALVPLIDSATGKEKSILTHVAVRNLDQLVRSGRTSDPSYTKGRLVLTRLKGTMTDAEIAAWTGGGNTGSGGGSGAGANGGNPVFVETTARRVIYLVDGSGSMMNKFDIVRKATNKAVAELKPTQWFDVVVMNENADGATPFSKRAVAATDANKTALYAFMKRTQPHGSSDPLPAMRFAFDQGPDVIYFLTDGDFPNSNQVIADVARWNSAKRVKIHTIAFIDRGESYERVLKALSTQSGGEFRSISDADVADLK